MAAPLPRLYDDLAWLWPLLSPPEQYLAEALLLLDLIDTRLGPGPHTILELGAGGGHTLVHLDARGGQPLGGDHHCTAVDLSGPMLEHCRQLIPGIETHTADMRNFELGQTFDVVLIHDAIDYLLTADDVASTLQRVHDHLRPGGLALIAPTYTRETFSDGESADDAAASDTHDLTYFSYVHDPDESDSSFEMILLYLIRDAQTRAVEVVEDRHTCGLFTRADWLSMIESAGLSAEFVEQGDEDADGAWSLFVGRRVR